MRDEPILSALRPLKANGHHAGRSHEPRQTPGAAYYRLPGCRTPGDGLGLSDPSDRAAPTQGLGRALTAVRLGRRQDHGQALLAYMRHSEFVGAEGRTAQSLATKSLPAWSRRLRSLGENLV